MSGLERRMTRVFSFVAMILVLAVGMYIYSRQVKAISPTPANNPKATVNLVGVRMDLSNIANAERRYMPPRDTTDRWTI
jgi:hypothetical protein